MPSLFTQQPFKFLYTIFTVTTLPLRLLAIFLYYIPKSTRPHPKWTYHQAVGNRILGLWFWYTTVVEFRTAKSLQPRSEEGDRFTVISPPITGDSPYRGILRHDPAIRPGAIGAVWYTAPPPPGEIPNLVVIYFHAGGYVLGSARQPEGGYGFGMLSKAIKCPVLAVQYRLSVEENATFPAAIQDGITAFAYVLNTLGVRPENIVLAGESAGANLAFTMLRYLSEDGRAVLPLPRAVLLWSPWLDLNVKAEEIDRHPNISTDYISGALVAWGVRRYTPKGWSSGHPYISPLGNEFRTEVPVLVQTGTAEVMYDEHCRFVQAMRENGSRVELLEIENAPHDAFGAALTVGFVKQAEDAGDRAAIFVKEAGDRNGGQT